MTPKSFYFYLELDRQGCERQRDVDAHCGRVPGLEAGGLQHHEAAD